MYNTLSAFSIATLLASELLAGVFFRLDKYVIAIERKNVDVPIVNVPDEIPRRCIIQKKNGTASEVDARSVYIDYYICGWQSADRVLTRAPRVSEGNFTADLCIPVMQGSVLEISADQRGRADRLRSFSRAN